ncbi:hypothetical protein BGP77_03895 [Saccharospirillum sp. MSK14-1]|uniref:FG-GAP-like repeat-containing protein n=1 Tax=Saccharospirillum sp. MSK14-1 TaxID=1897632 RepID=UPI000D46B2C2|nr:FG-GAP-like repeat-containing protein [Saccharospirillum sp. MSK14-1]PTY36451.1 hypothetical protein BGP77_03895 [Saccharospirillum sp. MSK14-1]
MSIKRSLFKIGVSLVALCAGISEAVSFQDDSYDIYENQNGNIYFLAKKKLLLIAGEISIPIQYKDGKSFYLNVSDNTIHSLNSTPSMSGLTALSGYEVYTGDFNGDGWSDMYLHPLASGSKIKAYLINGGSGFRPTEMSNYSWIAGHEVVDLTPVIHDYNGDGTDDLIFTSPTGEQVPLFQYNSIINENNSSPVTGNVVGQTDFSATVSKGGAANIGILLETPVGATGLSAPVSMSYNSQSGSGNMGRGWSVSIGGSIARCQHEYPLDRPLTYTASDAYCFQGERLVAISGTHGAAGSLYRTQVDSGVLIEAHGSYLGEPQYWSVHTPNGDISYYGDSESSRLEHTDGAAVLSWALSSTQKISGAEYEVNYSTDANSGEQLLESIVYVEQSASIQFEWDDRANVFTGWSNGARVSSSKRLSSVTMLADGETQRVYNVHYSQDNRTNKPLVIAIQECSDNGDCYKPLTFDYESTNSNNDYENIATYNNNPDSDYVSNSLLTGDINNDGFTDILYIGKKGGSCTVWVCNNNDATVLKFRLSNGDGTYRHVGSLGITPSNRESLPATYNLVDVNFDGYFDVVQTSQDHIKTWFGNARLGQGQNRFSSPRTDSFDSSGVSVQFADVDMDGYPDLITHERTNQWQEFSRYRTRVYEGNGDGTYDNSHSIQIYPEYYNKKPPVLTDYDGNGEKEFLFHNADINLDEPSSGPDSKTWRELLAIAKPGQEDLFSNRAVIYRIKHRELALDGHVELDAPSLGLPHHYQDITNDGVPDRIVEDDYQLHYYEGHGDGQFDTNPTTLPLRYARASTYESSAADTASSGTQYADVDGSLLDDSSDGSYVIAEFGGDIESQLNSYQSSEGVVYAPISSLQVDNEKEKLRTLIFEDINNDGYIDIIEHRPVENNGAIFVKYGSYFGFTTSNTLEGVDNSTDDTTLRFLDLDGDGVRDLMSFSNDTGQAQTYVSQSSHRPMLTTIDDGLGNLTTFTWSRMTDTDVYTKGIGKRPNGEKDVISNRRLVAQMTSPSGVEYYRYSGARQRIGRDGYLGFQHFVRTTQRTSLANLQGSDYQTRALVTATYLHQDAPYIGRTEKVVTFNVVSSAEEANDAVNFFAASSTSDMIPRHNTIDIGSDYTAVSNWRENQWDSINANGIEFIYLEKYITRQFDFKSQDRLLQQSEVEEVFEKPQSDSYFARRVQTIVRTGGEENALADNYQTEVVTDYDYKYASALYGEPRDFLVSQETTAYTEDGKETLIDAVENTFDTRNRLETRTTYTVSESQALDGSSAKNAIQTEYAYTSDSISTLYSQTVSSVNRMPGELGYAPPRVTLTEFSSIYDHKYLTAQTRLSGSGSSASDQTVQYDNFDQFGNPRTVTNFNGTQSFQQTDGFGNVISTTDSWGVVTSHQYYFCSSYGGSHLCPSDAVYTEQSRVVGDSGQVQIQPTSYLFFDARGREIGSATQLQFGAWSVSKKEWDTYDRLVLETTPVSAFSYYSDVPTQGVYNKRYYYDLNDRIVVIEQDNAEGLGVNRRTNEYTVTGDTGGYEKRVTDGKGRQRYEYYDAQGRLISTRETYLANDGDGNSTARDATIHHLYDVKGRKLDIEYPGLDGTGMISSATRLHETYTYDDANGVFTEEIPDKAVADVTRTNAYGNVVEHIDANGVTTRYQYDVMGRKTSQRVGDVLSCWYYDRAQPSKYSGIDNAIAIGTLDSVVTYQGGARTTCPVQTDVVNALTDANIAIAKDYRLNAHGVLEQETVYTGQMVFVTDYEYDAYGRLETKTLPLVPGEYGSGLEPTRVGMEYSDSTGYPTALTNGLSGSQRVVYEANTDMDHFGNVVEKTLGSTTLVRSFDPATSRVASIQATANDSVLVDYEYEFNIVGEIIGRSESITNRDEKFGYLDGYSRQITNVWVKGINESDSSYRAEETYVYDALGNIRQHRRNDYHNNVTFDMDYNYEGKRLTDITGTFGSNRLQEDFDYDNNGNVTSLGFYALEYNSRNLLSKVASSNRSDTTEYWYDENGTRYKRTAKIENIVTNTFMMDGYERVESGGWVEHRHYIGSNTLLTTNDFGSKTQQHFIRDHIGSIVAVVDDEGSVLQRKRYTVFGEEIETFTASGLPQMLGITEKGFTNHEHIPGFQLIHMGGRLYHPRLGRFLQADIVIQNTKAPVNFSRYAYVMNNPLGYTDPSGYLWKEVKEKVKKIVSRITGSGSRSNSNDHQKSESDNETTNPMPEPGSGDTSEAENPNIGDESESQIEPVDTVDELEPGALDSPVGASLISSLFGAVRTCEVCSKVHPGTDYLVPVGTDVVATADGSIARAYTSVTYGKTVIIDHGESRSGEGNVYTLYAHGSEISVEENQQVKMGQKVLTSGNTGNSTGPHLHYEVIKSTSTPFQREFYGNLNERYAPAELKDLL